MNDNGDATVFNYTDSTGQWEIITGGQQHQVKSATVSDLTRTEVTAITNGDGTVISQTTQTFYAYPWAPN